MPANNLCITLIFSRDVAAGVRRQRGSPGLGLEARAGRGGARRHHDRRPQASLRQGEGGDGQEGKLILGYRIWESRNLFISDTEIC